MTEQYDPADREHGMMDACCDECQHIVNRARADASDSEWRAREVESRVKDLEAENARLRDACEFVVASAFGSRHGLDDSDIVRAFELVANEVIRACGEEWARELFKAHGIDHERTAIILSRVYNDRDEGWFRAKTEGAIVSHYFEEGAPVSACGSLRRLEGKPRRDGLAARQSSQRGFLAVVEPEPAEGVAHCQRCEIAIARKRGEL